MNPLFNPSNAPTNNTKPSKAVNDAKTSVRLTHNTFDNSYFNFKTQRYGQYEPFWWKVCVAGDNEPYSNSHNVRSLPFASPILSPMKLNKDYFQIPMYAIQPNTWDYIFKNPNQGDDVPLDAQNLFPLFSESSSLFSMFEETLQRFNDLNDSIGYNTESYWVNYGLILLTFMYFENFLSSGSLLYSMGYKFNPVFRFVGANESEKSYSYDEVFDMIFSDAGLFVEFEFDDPDSSTGTSSFVVTNDVLTFADYFDRASQQNYVLDTSVIISLIRQNFGRIKLILANSIRGGQNLSFSIEPWFSNSALSGLDGPVDIVNVQGVDCIRMDIINAYQLACSQYYVNPRVDFIYNAQLYRDNFIGNLRASGNNYFVVNVDSFDYNGIPVLYDFFSLHYYQFLLRLMERNSYNNVTISNVTSVGSLIYYLFGYREQLRFGNYLTDSRTQALGYGDEGSDFVQVFDDGVSVTDMSQKLVLSRFRSAVAHLDGSAEDYLATMFKEQMPPDYHFPKIIAHSEFAIAGDEVSNTTSDNQGNIVTNLKSGSDSAEFNIEVSLPSILIGVSYISIPEVYSQIKERHYMHLDRYDMFQPMLQYFGDQEIYNREVSDDIPNAPEAYGFVSRNGEYKQRLSQVSGGFLTSLRSWVFTVDLPVFAGESSLPRLVNTQSPLAIRAHDYEFDRFLARRTGLSLGTGFHFIMQYNNKNVDNRPMDVNPLPLYPNNSL